MLDRWKIEIRWTPGAPNWRWEAKHPGEWVSDSAATFGMRWTIPDESDHGYAYTRKRSIRKARRYVERIERRWARTPDAQNLTYHELTGTPPPAPPSRRPTAPNPSVGLS